MLSHVWEKLFKRAIYRRSEDLKLAPISNTYNNPDHSYRLELRRWKSRPPFIMVALWHGERWNCRPHPTSPYMKGGEFLMAIKGGQEAGCMSWGQAEAGALKHKKSVLPVSLVSCFCLEICRGGDQSWGYLNCSRGSIQVNTQIFGTKKKIRGLKNVRHWWFANCCSCQKLFT